MTVPNFALENPDDLARLLFSPRDNRDNGLGPLSLTKSFVFQSSEDYKESVNCHRLIAEIPADIHKEGKAQATARNVARAARAQALYEYKGYADVKVEAVLTAKAGDHEFTVEYTPITDTANDNEAHCDIRLVFPGVKPKTAQRTLAIELLAEKFSDIRSE